MNLTHDNADWCKSVLSDTRSLVIVVKLIVLANSERNQARVPNSQDSDRSTQNLDTLCLSLALLTNLIYEETSTKCLLRSTSSYDPTGAFFY